jgi:hypothetical protein
MSIKKKQGNKKIYKKSSLIKKEKFLNIKMKLIRANRPKFRCINK